MLWGTAFAAVGTEYCGNTQQPPSNNRRRVTLQVVAALCQELSVAGWRCEMETRVGCWRAVFTYRTRMVQGEWCEAKGPAFLNACLAMMEILEQLQKGNR